ncbi:Tyrosine-protein kinase [Parasponia andersonii]|uniref:Tyrosine-protein kinase n=1 Tax=Parasponia andersonii TaxID=3476 RepID=A0A2P5AVZ6_PARAD|nr:Tyrosine-protein kinase [Parasponia andersonii]
MDMASPLSPSHVLIVYDATKDRSECELQRTVHNVRMRGDILRPGDTLVVLGILHTLQHPMGYHTRAYSENFVTSDRATEKEVSKKVDAYVKMLLQSAEICEIEGISVEVKITAGFPIKQVILQEVTTCNAAWVLLDRLLRRDMRFHIKQIPCKVALIQDGLSVELEKIEAKVDADITEHKYFISLSKPVPVPSSTHGLISAQSSDITDQPVISCTSHSFSISLSGSLDTSDMVRSNSVPSSSNRSVLPAMYTKGDMNYLINSRTLHKQQLFRQRCSEAPILCTTCGARTETYYIKDAMLFKYTEIQQATDDFAKENLLGEGGYGHVYKGKLQDGQLIAAKVRKEESNQGFAEFHSEVYVLSFARHKNIVMLLGYCSREKFNILVYEYICNKSLDWHLFDKTATPLEWYQRFAIAIGTAKGLRFLHEECRGGPIIHRDVRPSNILLTHDFIPMLGDFGLAKWKTSDDPLQTRILGTLGYLAPEYAENGIVSVRTDVYAYGIVLLQLMSGRKVVFDAEGEEKQQSLRQWAEPIIQRLALHELIDPRIGDSYDTYELYRMAKAAYSCVQRSPEMRPSIGEVVRLLEGENDHFRHFGDQFVPHFTK